MVTENAPHGPGTLCRHNLWGVKPHLVFCDECTCVGATDMQSEKKPDTRQQAWWTLTEFRFKVYGLGFLGIGFELQEL